MTPQQIKFRGFRDETNEAVYGNLIYNGNDYLIREIEHDKGFHKSYFVEPDSLGMFTGRTDKNGKEIYGAIGERGGDKIKLTTEFIVFVKYRYGAFVIESEINGEYFFSEELPLSLCAEIIGNQWEVDNGK